MLKGKKHTEETKRKISENRKGKGLENQNGFKKGQKSWNKGIPNTWYNPKGLELGRDWNKGKKLSEETRKKMSLSHLGKLTWNKGIKGICKANSGSFKKGQFINEKHPNWKFDKVGYFALHSWIKRKLGRPKKCEHCGTKKAKKFEWCNIGHTYKRNLNDWIRLCTSCHRKFDILK